MATFSIDLGFDWEIREENKVKHLQHNFVKIGENGAQDELASYYGVIKVGDDLQFRIFDLSGDNETRSIVYGKLTFMPAYATDSGPDSPIDLPQVGIRQKDGERPWPHDFTPAFNGEFPCYLVTVAITNATKFLVNNPGRFIWTAFLILQDEEGDGLFRVDPEMDVDEGDG